MKDVSVYARTGRPVYYVSYDCPTQLRRIHLATPFRVDHPESARRALDFAMEKAKEVRLFGDGAQSERWSTWVLPFLEHQYRKSPLTFKRYTGAWKWLSLFLIVERKIHVPRAVSYQDVRDFHQWRMGFKRKSGRSPGSNTALCDVKALQVIMNEAVKRGFAPSNPCLRVGIRKEKARSARELTTAELALIEARLPAFVAEEPKERNWMPVAYQIARHQGCRLRETRLDLRTQVSLRDNSITFLTKGKKETDGDATLLHPNLRPLFAAMIAEKRQFTLDYGPRPSQLWRKFLDSVGLRDAWFHCLRSTVITELARAGVPISQAMRFVLHANREIHRTYQRLKPGDLSSCTAAIAASTPTRS